MAITKHVNAKANCSWCFYFLVHESADFKAATGQVAIKILSLLMPDIRGMKLKHVFSILVNEFPCILWPDPHPFKYCF